MTVIDTSAIIAIINKEPDSEIFIDYLKKNKGNICISSISVLETCIIASRTHRPNLQAIPLIRSFLDVCAIQIIDFNAEQSYLAARAYQTYGKGNHRANLNFGDCASYALTVYLNTNLLYKGNDFTYTNITKAT